MTLSASAPGMSFVFCKCLKMYSQENLGWLYESAVTLAPVLYMLEAVCMPYGMVVGMQHLPYSVEKDVMPYTCVILEDMCNCWRYIDHAGASQIGPLQMKGY